MNPAAHGPPQPSVWNQLAIYVVIAGRIVLPVGDYQKHLTHGELFIYHLPGR